MRASIPAFVLVSLAATGALGASARLRDLADVQGARDNAIFGYGLVVGLSGTGDSERVLFTAQSMSGMLGRIGVRVSPEQVRSRNVAAVMVTATLPAYARPGGRLDLTVSSLGDARSLEGGVLVLTPLLGPDGQVYAVAQGAVQTGSVLAESAGVRVRKNQGATARIPSGATIERAVTPELGTGPLVLALRRPDFVAAQRVAAAVNAALKAEVARAVDAAAIEIDAGGKSVVDIMASLEAVEIEVAGRARVVVSERTGTLVAGEGVRLRPAAVAHGGLQVTINKEPITSQPLPLSRGETARRDKTDVQVIEPTAAIRALPATATVDELVAALNALGATPRDLIAILQALQAAGALDAELVVM